MRTAAVLVAIFLVTILAASASAQSVDRTFYLTHDQTPQDVQEIATLMRTIVNFRELAAANDQRTIAVRGTSDQIALSEWLFNELDKAPPAPQSEDSTTHEFKAGNDDVVRLFYVTHVESVQQFQEVSTAVRTIANIRQVFTYNTSRVLALRAPADQIALANWLVKELDKPEETPNSGTHEYSGPVVGPRRDSPGDIVRVFYLAGGESIQEFQEISTAVRTISNISQVFTYNARRALILRSQHDPMMVAEWLVQELDKPTNVQPAASVAHEYRVPGSTNDVVRVFYIPAARSAQEFQQVATAIRTVTNIRQLFTYNARKALAVRGTFDQMTQAEGLLQ